MPGKEPEKNLDENLNKLGSGNQSDIALRFANSFSGRHEITDIGKVISQINWPLKFSSRAISQKTEETQGEWNVVFTASIGNNQNVIPGKIPLNVFDFSNKNDAIEKGNKFIKELETQNYNFGVADIAYVLKEGGLKTDNHIQDNEKNV